MIAVKVVLVKIVINVLVVLNLSIEVWLIISVLVLMDIHSMLIQIFLFVNNVTFIAKPV